MKQNRVFVRENTQIKIGIKITIDLANILERNHPPRTQE